MNRFKTFVSVLFIFFILFSCNNANKGDNALSKTNNSETKKSTSEITKDPFLVLYEDLMLPGTGKLFRGVDFDMSRTDIRKIEMARAKCSETDSEKDNQLIITTDMGPETLDFADIKYTFDEKGMYYIEVETYSITKAKADYVFNKVKEYYTKSLGEGKLADDGYLEFLGSNKRYKYQVAMKEIVLEATEKDDASYGMFLLFSMK